MREIDIFKPVPKTMGIYLIESPNGRRYVGQSVNFSKRFEAYRNLRCKYQTKLYRSIVKYGLINHKFYVLEEITDVDELTPREIYWGNFFKVLDRNRGLNLLLPKEGEVGGHSEETKLKMSISAKKRKPNNGRPLIDTKTGQIYINVKEASIALGIKRQTLNAMLSGQNKNRTNLIYK